MKKSRLAIARPGVFIQSVACSFAVFVIALLWATTSSAGNFIGLAQPGVPGTFGVLLMPSVSHSQPDTNTGKMFSELAYYSETGFTGTTRDQFEAWLGFYGGYQDTPEGSRDSSWGVTMPELGFEYYYQVVQPGSAAFGSDEYRSWWVSPELMFNGPNGSDKTTGFGAGGNQWSIATTVNNYVAYGRWHATFAPVSLVYLFKNRNSTDLGDGQSVKMRGALSVSLADVAAGYQVKDDLIVGLHHAYNIYNIGDSDYARASEGMIGPTFTYLGFAKDNFYLAGTLDFDYHHQGVPRTTSLNFLLVKSF
jgi:hypothetical protein